MPRLPEGIAAEYVALTEGDYRGWVHRAYRSALPPLSWIATAEPGPGAVLKDSPRTTVYRLHPPGGGPELVVKRYNRRRAWRGWKDGIRLPRALGSLRQGAAFLRAGVPTPVPLAAVAAGRVGRRSWLVTPMAPGSRRLPELVQATPRGDPCRGSLMAELVQLVRKMHHRHLYHGDLKPVNIIVTGEDGCRGLSLVDLDRARIRRRRSWSLAVRDLAQLDSYLRKDTAGAERRGFFRLYASGWPRGARRRFLAAVVRESNRRMERRCAG